MAAFQYSQTSTVRLDIPEVRPQLVARPRFYLRLTFRAYLLSPVLTVDPCLLSTIHPTDCTYAPTVSTYFKCVLPLYDSLCIRTICLLLCVTYGCGPCRPSRLCFINVSPSNQ